MVGPPPLRIVFFGTPAFAIPTLEALIASRHEVAAAVSQPDRPKGRGRHAGPTPVKTAAAAAGVRVLQPERLKDPPFREELTALAPDLGVVAAYGKILPAWLIAIPRFGLINVHASLLPRYRGAAPIQRAVMAGDAETGVTIMRIVEALDAGPTFARAVRPVPPDATAADVERDLAHAGADLLITVVDAIAAGTAVEAPQDDRLATYAPKITAEEERIDWARPAREIRNLVRALSPRAWTMLDGARILVTRTEVEEEPAGAAPGEIIESAGGLLRVATGDGTIRIEELQPAGRRVMTAREFLAGRRPAPGARLS